ncbi:MAG: thioredoxin domain-containing protein, partial [Bacteroidota bacterium]
MWRFLAGYLLLFTMLCTCGLAPEKGGKEGRTTSNGGGNHLVGQKSPYLLQHANNPVDWYPWGEPALEKAKAEDKLLVISVGYAACHWCHVMEHESFEDSLVAAVMNEHFVSIKVDREERPDVDEVYMTACQLTNQRGCGWPLNAIALPDGRPIWAGTYFPKNQWLKILERFTKLRLSEPGKMEEYAAGLTDELVRQNSFDPATKTEADLSSFVANNLATDLHTKLDRQLGGAQGAPKFPLPGLHEFLLTHHFHTQDEASLQLVNKTLTAMAAGGIYDQLDGGFARYSTDEEWLVPHFEKMLYDNAQLVSLYAQAYQLTKQERYATVVRETLEFVDRRLSHPDGIFYASLDADTEGEEGKTYVWTLEEIEEVLSDAKLAGAFTSFYGVSAGGNWEGHNILTRQADLVTTAKKHKYASAEDFQNALDGARIKLRQHRDGRAQPPLDDKALTSWNALMISGYADAYRALGTAAYRGRAVQAGNFIWKHIRDEDNRLNRNFKGGSSAINAFLDDYAFLAQAYVDLYQITFEETWLSRAAKLI